MSMSNFCQVKTAYLLDINHEKLIEENMDGEVFDVFEDYANGEPMKYGWGLVETRISGAAGCVLIFETDEYHGRDAYEYLDNYITNVEHWCWNQNDGDEAN